MENNSEFELVGCPICGNQNLRRIARKGQFDLPCFVAACPQDGLVCLSPRWVQERYEKFYRDEYDSYYRSAVFGEESHEDRYATTALICERLESLGQMHQHYSSVLDVGAGMGWSLDYIRKNYSQFDTFLAIESSDHCVRNLEMVVRAEVLAKDIGDDWVSEPIDLIIMRHVLEHFLDPVRAIQQASHALKSSGILYIAVPDMMNPRGSLKKHWFRSVHTYYYNRSTLTQIAARGGMRPIHLESENSELWGVFCRTASPKPAFIDTVNFRRQMRVIRRRKLWDLTRGLKPRFLKLGK